MSTQYVRTEILNYLTTTLPTEKFLDISGESDNIQDFLASKNVKITDNWVGLTFVANNEQPMCVVSNGLQGKYREDGVIEIHVVAKAKPGMSSQIISRADTIISSLRGRRIGDIIIESIVPPNFGTGSTMDFEAGMTSAVVLASYERDLNL